ncbi:MAG: hypothetical protein IPH22_11765 [Nitrosomonas sp.]|nr:hypothetical protein [Nitrosomonas sp.]
MVILSKPCFIAGVIVVAIQADHWRLRCPVCKAARYIAGESWLDASGSTGRSKQSISTFQFSG